MESIQQSYNDNFMKHAPNGPPNSLEICNIVGAPQLNPRLGHEYQVEVPSIIKQSEWLQLLMNPADAEIMHDNSLSFAIGLPISVTWIHSEVEDGGYRGWGYLGDIGKELKPITFQSVIIGGRKSSELEPGKRKKYLLAPSSLSNSWSDADAKSFLLGLFIFGKNFIQIKRFLENKGMGEVLSFYYGKFYKSNEYRRWSDCRKVKGRKCMIGQKFFTGWRQHELLSRLIPHVSKESQDTLLQVSKSYMEGRVSLEEYISSLKSTVGLGVLVEAVGIGKEKEDLTSLAVEPGKNNQLFSAPICKAWSSLGSSDIIKFLTGGFRLSKAKSNDLFWEAVWPRLLARGWHSEQPMNQGYVSSKDYLVFLTPGIKKFSRRKLVKGDHYFDSVSDVLSKVVAEPNLLDLDEEAKVVGCNDKEPEKGSNNDDQFDYHRQHYLQPQASTSNTDHIKFTVIDTSLVHGGKSSGLREFKSVPVNSVGKVEVNAAGITCKGAKHVKKVNNDMDMSENIDQNLTKFTVIDTSMLCEGRLLKVRKVRYLPAEVEDASKMTGLSSGSNGNSYDDSSSMVEANKLIYNKKKISNTDSKKGMSDIDITDRKEPYDSTHYNANKMVESQKNKKTSVSDDNQLKTTIKHQFSRRARSGHSNLAVLPIKRRRLTACAKAETSRIIENSSRSLESEKLAFSQSLSFPDAPQNVAYPVSHQQNGSFIVSSADRSVEEKNKESIINEICQCMSVSCVKVENCESQLPVTFNIPQAPSDPGNGEMMAMVGEDEQCLKENDPHLSSDTQVLVEGPPRTSCDVGSMEQQPSINSRRQSTRNRPLTVRALESLANEFLHVQRRQKRKEIQTHKDVFSPCRRARTRGKTMLHRHSSDHGTAVLVEERHLSGDCTVSEIFASH